MNLLDRFHQHLHQTALLYAHEHLLLAVSGGLDSAVLTHLCVRAGFNCSIAHCNFQLRGDESERDEAFVRSLASTHGLTLYVQKFDTLAHANAQKISIQEAARQLRYAWFHNLVTETIPSEFSFNADNKSQVRLLTAHHANDNIETVLMHFCRGTGLRGLTGIPAMQGYIRRPLLPFTREELAEYAAQERLSYVEDSSNAEEKYTRNYFRHSVLPAIAKVYPQVQQNIADNIRRFSAVEALYRMGVTQILQKLCKKKGEELYVPVKPLLQFNNSALIYELIHPYGFTERQVAEVIKLAQGNSGSYIESPEKPYRIIRHRHWLIIAPKAPDTATYHTIEESDSCIYFAGGQLKLQQISPNSLHLDAGNRVAFIDAAQLQYPLLLRRWKAGDYFYPLGMRKKKKLARFFIDCKLSRAEKENIWVLESAQRVVWVLGYRIDDRFKITDKTKKVLRLEWV